MTHVIQEDLAQHRLLPDEQIVDTGYVDANLLVSSPQNYGISLLGPVLSDNSWQSQAGKGFDVAHFHFNWQAQLATCPQGQTSSRWSLAGERMEVVFARELCAACPVRRDCTRSSTTGRVLHVRPQAAHEALQARRHEQETPAFRQAYQTRAGIEGTLSQAVRGMGIRRARYDGLPKTQVQHVLTAVAINLVRMDAVLTETSRGKTRRSDLCAWHHILVCNIRRLFDAYAICNGIRQQSLIRKLPLSQFQAARILMTLHVFLLLLLLVLMFSLVRLCSLCWPHHGLAQSAAATRRTPLHRLLKPRSPHDCPACRLSCAHSSVVEPVPPPVRPWREVKSRRGAPKRVNTEGFACPNRECTYSGITDARIHALVGDGTHGQASASRPFAVKPATSRSLLGATLPCTV